MTPLAGRAGTILLAGALGLPLKQDSIAPWVGEEHTWRLVDGRNWQIESGEAIEPAGNIDARERTRGDCKQGMVAVRGAMKRGGAFSVEELQNESCTEWISRTYPERCATFDRTKFIRTTATLATRPMRFCIDRFEYPNERNEYPVIDVTWEESVSLCKQEGKRLCNESEWTFACEGEEATPYPTGYKRDASACVIDRPWRPVNERALSPRGSHTALVEIDRLWQGEASGSRPDCRSSFGVYDLTGNVDEWTSSAIPGERASVLKGGYWGPDRARCQPSTRAHGEEFSYYQQGFRCCADLD